MEYETLLCCRRVSFLSESPRPRHACEDFGEDHRLVLASNTRVFHRSGQVHKHVTKSLRNPVVCLLILWLPMRSSFGAFLTGPPFTSQRNAELFCCFFCHLLARVSERLVHIRHVTLL